MSMPAGCVFSPFTVLKGSKRRSSGCWEPMLRRALRMPGMCWLTGHRRHIRLSISFFGCKEDRGVARQPLFDTERAAAKREELNLLYVAITRARQVFIASGIEHVRHVEGTPYRLLETALGKIGDGLAHGDALPIITVSAEGMTPSAKDASPIMPRVGERRSLPGDAERFGILLHALLERRTENAETGDWWKMLGFDEGEYRRALPVAERLLVAPGLQRFFDSSKYCQAWNEIDLASGDGVLRRIDRWSSSTTQSGCLITRVQVAIPFAWASTANR